jgi:hypothetical protein
MGTLKFNDFIFFQFFETLHRSVVKTKKTLKTKSGTRKAPENWTQQVSKELRLAQHWHIPDIETGITSGPYHSGRASTTRLEGSLLPVLTHGASLYSRPTLVTMVLHS